MTISYNNARGVLGLVLRWKGSIWRSVWKELIVFLVLYYVIQTFYRHIMPLLDESGDFTQRFETLCRMFEDYTTKIPLTFLLGFYVSNIVARWWGQFEALYWPEDLLSLLCTILPGTDERSERRRHTIARYVNLTAALAWRDASTKVRRRFPNMKSIADAGLMTEKERVLLEALHTDGKFTRWMTPLHWIQQIIADEVKDNPSCSPSQFIGELKDLRKSFRRLFCYDWVCVPLVYTQVATLATYSYFFFCLFGRQYLDSDTTGKRLNIYFPLFTVVQFLFFVGWFKVRRHIPLRSWQVGQDLMRPFGLDDDDIEMNYIFDRNVTVSFNVVNRLQMNRYPDIEDDAFWANRQTKPQIPHTPYSRIIAEHAPKLHSYVPLVSPTKPDGLTLETEERRGPWLLKSLARRATKHVEW